MSAAVVVRERPILFSGEMVRAILDGQKTQTRRVVKAKHSFITGDDGVLYDADCINPGKPITVATCPYGQPGDRLWVRETWASLVFERDWESGYIDGWHEPADPRAGKIVYNADDHGFNDGGNSVEERGFAWRPSIFMPRWASRITLEITGVRVERVCSISAADAEAEGVLALPDTMKQDAARACAAAGKPTCQAVDYFAHLWQQLNWKRGYSWGVNPWVWVIAFRRVES